MGTDETTLFESAHVETVASESGIDPDRLSEALSAHQTSVEELPGVEDIVYEWRKQYEDPLLSRTDDAYYLVVPRQVWDEFGNALDLDDEVLDAVVAVHHRTVSAACDVSPSPADGVAYVALDRTL